MSDLKSESIVKKFPYFVIAIDGTSGCGKSTIAKRLSAELNILYVNTGAIYRAFAYLLWKEKLISLELLSQNVNHYFSDNDIDTYFKNFNFYFEGDSIFLNGTDISNKIQNPKIAQLTSWTSSHSRLRENLKIIQKDLCIKGKCILEGRDIGSVIWPQAEFKFFLFADAKTRAKRRHLQIIEKGGQSPGITQIIQSIKDRDFRDSNREIAPLIIAPGAHEIDTSHLSIPEVIDQMKEKIKQTLSDE